MLFDDLNATAKMTIFLLAAGGAWWGWRRLRAPMPTAIMPRDTEPAESADDAHTDTGMATRVERLETKLDLLLARATDAALPQTETQADIVRLHDAGHSIRQIAETLELAQGEVTLVLRMRERTP